MKDYVIPADIKSHVAKKRARKILLWLLFTAVIVVLIVLLGERSFGRLNLIGRYTIYFVLVISPFFTLRMYELFDFSWSGTIKKIDIKYSTDSTRGFKPSRETLYSKETVVFYIDVNGRTIKKKVFEGPSGSNTMSQYYREGDRVIHIGGTDHIRVVNSDRIICFVCGATNDAKHESCKLCHHSLIIQPEDKSV